MELARVRDHGRGARGPDVWLVSEPPDERLPVGPDEGPCGGGRHGLPVRADEERAAAGPCAAMHSLHVSASRPAPGSVTAEGAP